MGFEKGGGRRENIVGRGCVGRSDGCRCCKEVSAGIGRVPSRKPVRITNRLHTVDEGVKENGRFLSMTDTKSAAEGASRRGWEQRKQQAMIVRKAERLNESKKILSRRP